ncbi:hypothetical protein F1188_06755 [Roseospira marina]|uniref:AzlC family ABC transporter permease n=1 Tax=Roseospira marina TaxID=140057 RepID=A0A5M6IDH8_9PROT|nr:AzlC family ABC transporter permease [Roseospira marina]KAA5606122.1 hypothetical protein F1188_06755 [Roseospira marina]MBB4314260.1 putative branched-subunit amino acid permease [Roseospira marina]MBB5087420.1 putative branched-subunit amino acid permease [Roseospira marina]
MSASPPAPPPIGETIRLVVRDALVVILTFVVMFMGVGRASAEAGLNALQTAFMTLFTVAAPAQAAAMQILDSDTAGATAWVAAVVAVIIVNLRFMVMAASILGRLPNPGVAKGIGAIGLISASSFAILLPRLMGEAPRRPILYCGLVGLACSLSAVFGAVLGHQIATAVPVLVGTALGAMIPIYFATLIARQGRHRILMLNALAGAVLVPLAAPLLGSFSLIVVPLVVSGLTLLIPSSKEA